MPIQQFIPQNQTYSLTILNQILQKTLNYLVFQPQNSLNFDDYALTPLFATSPQQQTDQPIQVAIPLLRDKKIQWTLIVDENIDNFAIRIATGARVNHCQLILTISNKSNQIISQNQIDGEQLEDNSWVQCKLTKNLAKGQYLCQIHSPDADNQNNVLFLWLTTKNSLDAQNVILTQHHDLEPIVSLDKKNKKSIQQFYPLLKSNILQWTWHQSHFQPIEKLYFKLGTGGRQNQCQLQLKIFTLNWQYITQSIITAQKVEDGEWTIFSLQNPLPENTTYILQLSSSDAATNDAIFVYLQNVGLENYQFKPIIEDRKIQEKDIMTLFLIIPTFIYNLYHVENCLNHITQQTTSKWQLTVLVDKNTHDLALLQSYQQSYPQQINIIQVDFKNAITYCLNEIIHDMSDSLCCFLNINHILEPNALEIILSEFEQNPQTQLIYSDHDAITPTENLVQPCFKAAIPIPENNALYFYRSHILQNLQQEYELIIWESIAENLKNWLQNYQTVYLPLILQNTYQNHIEQQLDAINAQLIQQHKAQHITKILYHQYPSYPLQNIFFAPEIQTEVYTPNLKISIIIPNKDLAQDLKRCIDSIIHNTSYSNWEIIIVDNGSQQAETFELYQYYQQKSQARFKQINCNIPFNFSKLVNIGVEQATGEIILLLNNDTEVLKSQNWLEKMLGFTQQKNIACVGCKLIYPQDHTIQHAGIICGIGGIANHGHKHQPMYSQGHCNRLSLPNYYSAITGACLMVSKYLWQQVNGFDEKLAVAFNDVDFCLKLQQLGYQHIVLPDVYLYHYESKSRGLETTPEQQQRLAQETQIMKQRWGELLDNDPYYNPHLTKKSEDFSLSENSTYYTKS
ncbi:MAG: glycosyltransferase family 2 protein [Thiotrichaceae bacterium]|nr:glycosyltransferase family 2 protein [Thiotrichaceae bacterium]